MFEIRRPLDHPATATYRTLIKLFGRFRGGVSLEKFANEQLGSKLSVGEISIFEVSEYKLSVFEISVGTWNSKCT